MSSTGKRIVKEGFTHETHTESRSLSTFLNLFSRRHSRFSSAFDRRFPRIRTIQAIRLEKEERNPKRFHFRAGNYFSILPHYLQNGYLLPRTKLASFSLSAVHIATLLITNHTLLSNRCIIPP